MLSYRNLWKAVEAVINALFKARPDFLDINRDFSRIFILYLYMEDLFWPKPGLVIVGKGKDKPRRLGEFDYVSVIWMIYNKFIKLQKVP